MSYTSPIWTNDAAPAINAENLQALSNEVESLSGAKNVTYTAQEGQTPVDMVTACENIGALSYAGAMALSDQQKETLAANMGSVTYMYTPNMLDNWYFPNPINQRGLSGTITTPGYTIDRWILSGGSMTISGGRITLNGLMVQRFEYWTMNGIPCTLSANIGGTIYSATITPSGSQNAFATVGGVTMGLYNGANYKEFRISSSSPVGIISLKVEAGSVSTLAYEPQPNFQQELAKCQRYYYSIRRKSGGGGALKFCNGAIQNSNSFGAVLSTPVPMRYTDAPNMSYSSVVVHLYPYGPWFHPVTSLLIEGIFPGTNIIGICVIDHPGGGLSAGSSCDFALLENGHLTFNCEL